MNDYEYTPNDIDSDIFLSEIPMSLMKENIIYQFENPLENKKKDHMITFINMYKIAKDNVNVYEDEEKDEVIEIRNDFYFFMMKMFHDYLNIGFPSFDEEDVNEQDHLLHYTYRFFLINIKKNFISFFLNYIENNRDQLEVSQVDSQKDITSSVFKKEISDSTDVYILSNLSSIIDRALHEECDVDKFFDYCDYKSTCLETQYVKQNFNNFKITGNFIEKYFSFVNSDLKSEVESNVRNIILMKYRK